MWDWLRGLDGPTRGIVRDGVAVAIDGQIYQDALFQTIGPESEVFLLPAIAGGSPAAS